jgi:hypothetical protein
MKLVIAALSLAVVSLPVVLGACSSSDSSGGGSGGGGGYGTGGGSSGGSGGVAVGGGGGVGGTGTGGTGTGGSGTGGSGTGGSSSGGSGGGGSCPLTIQGVSQQCADCITGSCCNEFVACGQDADCNAFNTCVVNKKTDCSAAGTDQNAIKACYTKDCPTSDASWGLWSTAQICAGQSCASVCQSQ